MSCSVETTDATLARHHPNIGPCRTVKVSHLNVHLIEAGSGQPVILVHGDQAWVEANLERIAAPTLVVWGQDDPWYPLSMAHEFGRRITGAQVVILPDCGHLPHEERPADFNRLILEFLAHHPGRFLPGLGR